MKKKYRKLCTLISYNFVWAWRSNHELIYSAEISAKLQCCRYCEDNKISASITKFLLLFENIFQLLSVRCFGEISENWKLASANLNIPARRTQQLCFICNICNILFLIYRQYCLFSIYMQYIDNIIPAAYIYSIFFCCTVYIRSEITITVFQYFLRAFETVNNKILC